MTHPNSAQLPTAGQTPAIGHYENFPVASILCPPHLRPAVAAIYHFARTADDIADEGDATPAQRLADLALYRADLSSALAGGATSSRWSALFQMLAKTAMQHALPAQLLHDLISAFEQDVAHTAASHRYTDTEELLAYCKLSANPIGRLLLHLYGVEDEASLKQSDHICSALQLINFWQDLSVDVPRQRHYLPEDALKNHQLTRADFAPNRSNEAATEARKTQLIAELCTQARTLMHAGAPLVHKVPGRAGWELRLVVQGGLGILDKIAAAQHRTWNVRPTVGKIDVPLMVWRALFMG